MCFKVMSWFAQTHQCPGWQFNWQNFEPEFRPQFEPKFRPELCMQKYYKKCYKFQFIQVAFSKKDLGHKLGPKLGLKILSIELPPWAPIWPQRLFGYSRASGKKTSVNSLSACRRYFRLYPVPERVLCFREEISLVRKWYGRLKNLH